MTVCYYEEAHVHNTLTKQDVDLVRQEVALECALVDASNINSSIVG